LTRAILLAADLERPMSGPVRSYVYELLIGAAGIARIELVHTVGVGLTAVGFDDRGVALIAANDGSARLLSAENELTEITRIEGAGVPGFYPFSITWTSDQDHPWFVSGRGALYLYDARGPRWETFSIPLTTFPRIFGMGGDDAINFEAVGATRTSTGALELWAAGAAGAIVKRIGGGEFLPINLSMPPRYAECSAGGEYPEIFFGEHIDHLRIAGEHVLTTVRGCSAMLEIRRSDNCVSLLGVENDPVGRRLMRDLQAIDLFDGQIVLAGEHAQIYGTR
jgi:hypothetical protein